MQYAVTASLAYTAASRWSVRASLGAVLGGELEGEGRTHAIGPGVVAAVSVSKQLVRGPWFVTGSLGAAASRTTTEAEAAGGDRRTLIAVDAIRAGAMAGRTLDLPFGTLSPYAMARAFGGPVWWTLDAMDVTGTDVHKFQVGAGAALTTDGGLSLLLDVSALGERSASLGASFRL